MFGLTWKLHQLKVFDVNTRQVPVPAPAAALKFSSWADDEEGAALPVLTGFQFTV